jgi:hypothetical protein
VCSWPRLASSPQCSGSALFGINPAANNLRSMTRLAPFVPRCPTSVRNAHKSGRGAGRRPYDRPSHGFETESAARELGRFVADERQIGAGRCWRVWLRNTRFLLILRFSKRSISHTISSKGENFARRMGSSHDPEKTFGTRHRSGGTSEGQFGLATQNNTARPFACCCIGNHRRRCFNFRHYPRLGLFSSVVADGIRRWCLPRAWYASGRTSKA